MSKRTSNLLLEDILEAIKAIRVYTTGLSFAEFFQDRKTQDAVVRNFEVIGEAANKLPSSLTKQYPEVDWSAIVGFRNILIHEYFGIDYQLVWYIIQHQMLALEEQIQYIVKTQST